MSILPDTAIRADDFTIVVEAGEALTVRDAVYVDPSDGKAYKCDADDIAKIGFAGFVLASVSMGSDVYILPEGILGGFSSLTPGAYYYISATAGAITATKPTHYKVVAKAITATTVKIFTDVTVRTLTFTASGTWTKPAGLLYIDVEVQGGGGGGDGTSGDSYGGGGGAGGYSKKRIYAADLGATETVTVGAAGTAGASTPTNGGAGGTSSFGAHCSATGGAGEGAGSAGGTGSGGDINIQGDNGGYGTGNSGTAGGYTTHGGGSSKFGAGGRPVSGGNNGNSGSGYGSGGSGGSSSNSNNYAGGAGAQGIVVVTEHY